MGGATRLRESASRSASSSVEIAVGEETGLETGAAIGDYVVTGELGRGGMGIVYAAQHPAIGKEVAIKVVHRSLSTEPGVKQRVLQEARILSEVRNSHVVDIYSFGELADGRYYLVMELVDGESLAKQLCSGPLPTLEAIDILLQIADALTACHASGVVHRDLKPDNIFLRRQAAGVDATLLDFGIAKVEGLNVGRGLTARGMILGTPEYMSPEQARAEEIDERSDLYSLGILSFEILIGQPPFGGTTVIETLHAILSETPASVCQLRPEVPRELGELVAELMEKNPDDRPSIQEVSVRLQSIRSLLVEPSFASQRLPAETATRLTTAGEHTAAGAESAAQAGLVPTRIRPPVHRFRRFILPALAAAALLLSWVLSTGVDAKVATATSTAGPREAEVGADQAVMAAVPPRPSPKSSASVDGSVAEASATIPEPQKASAPTSSRSRRVEKAQRRPAQRATRESAASLRRERLAPDGLLDPFEKKKR